MTNVSTTFLKFRIWAKAILLGTLALYMLLFVLLNRTQISLWYSPLHDRAATSLLVAIMGAFVLGALLTVLVRMALKTAGQMRVAHERGRTNRLQREVAVLRSHGSEPALQA